MYPLELRRQRAARLQLRADPVFDRLHVMIGARLDALDRADVGAGGILREGREPEASILGQRGQSGGGGTGSQCQHPCTLHAHPLAHQSRLAEQIAHRREFPGISAVERRERVNCGVGHRRSVDSVLDYDDITVNDPNPAE